ncbi:MAG: YegP family protein [Candidatus Accumulibacter sp.]|nr:YegP family protein [Accumulibacter sp.]
MGKFAIFRNKKGEFQFDLLAANGQVILTSEGYTGKSGCTNGIESVRKNAKSDKNFERKESSNKKFYFVLKAGNGQVIGTSQMYASAESREGGVESVKKNAPEAAVDDSTAA